MTIAIIGGGIVGCALALNLHRQGIRCQIFEQVPDLRELGVGISLLPHAMRELSALGLLNEICEAGVEGLVSSFYNRYGQLVIQEDSGRAAGYPVPEILINRGRLHKILYTAVRQRLGADSILTGHQCIGIDQDNGGVTLRFRDMASGASQPSVTASAAIACDGVNSTVRKQFYPADAIRFAGINMWRGVTYAKPILGGHNHIKIGSIHTAKLLIYPMGQVNENGLQPINWVAEILQDVALKNDWNGVGQVDDFIDHYKDWVFDWVDVPVLMRNAEKILAYPMVDKDPIDRWTFGRVTLAGDAAHPMYPRGSNGAAQGLIDARVLSEALSNGIEPEEAFRSYEEQRRPVTSKIVLTNRKTPPDFINIKVEQLTGDKPFENIHDVISEAELREIWDQYKKLAGFSKENVSKPAA